MEDGHLPSPGDLWIDSALEEKTENQFQSHVLI